MSPSFNRIMLDIGVGTNRKVRRLTIPERWTFVAGVLPLAAQSPIRGAMLIATSIPVTPQDVAEQAGVSLAVAKKTLGHMRTLGMLEHDDELGVEWVHDFQDWQAEPRSDPTGAPRQKRYRDKQKKTSRSNATGTVTRDVTGDVSNGGEVEEEEKTPLAPQGENDVTAADLDQARKRLRDQEFADWLDDHAAVTSHTPPRPGTKARNALASSFAARREEGYSLADLKHASRGAHADDYRREHGYDTAESVLRPTKVHNLIEKGQAAHAAAAADDPHAFVARLQGAPS